MLTRAYVNKWATPLFIFVKGGDTLDIRVEQIKNHLLPIILEKGFVLERLSYSRKNKENYLEIEVEREDLSPITLNEIEELSKELSLKLDEIDLIQEEYMLDVSTSGAEKQIKDFQKFPKLIGRKIEVRLKNPYKGENILKGIITKADDKTITLTYRIKSRAYEVTLDLNNIAKANLAV